MKIQVKRAFESCSFYHKKDNKKADRLFIILSSTPTTGVEKVPRHPIAKSVPPYSVSPSYLNPYAKWRKNIVSIATLVLQN